MELIARYEGREAEVHLEEKDDAYSIRVDGKTYEVDFAKISGDALSLRVDGRQYVVAVHPDGSDRYKISQSSGISEVELLDPLTYLARQAHGGAGAGAQQVTAYMPGRVTKLLATEGDEVESGQGIVVLEAMKMENEIQAERDGKVKKIYVQEGQAVEGGDVLFELE